MFELIEAACELRHKNDRIEKHGEEDVLAVDLDFTYETNNGVLAMFAPTLRSNLYMLEDGGQEPLIKDADHLTKLRNPALGGGKAFAWGAGELTGGELKFHHGVGGKSDVTFEASKIGKYKLECKEGGTVIVHFQAQIRPSDKEMSFLSAALRNKICTISVTPPGE